GDVPPGRPGGDPAEREDPLAAWGDMLERNHVPQEPRDGSPPLGDPEGIGPRIFFPQAPEEKAVKNRLHLDVRTASHLRGDEGMAALEERCAQLVALGATRLERHEPDGSMSIGFIVMADPEGNEFCLD